MKNLMFILVMIIGLTACGTQEVEENNNKFQGEKNMNGLVTKIEVSQNSGLDFKITLENTTKEDVFVNYRSGQTFEITVVNEEGEEVYRFSDGKMFTQAINTEMVEAHSKTTLIDEWDLIKDDERVSPGKYIVTGTLLIWTVDDEEVEIEDFTASKEIKIE